MQFINKALLASVGVLPMVLLVSCRQQEEQRPNFVFFLVDDMGWQDTSVPFYNDTTPLNRRYRTPNMERLAQMGVKFTEAYACAVSSAHQVQLVVGDECFAASW